MRTAGSEIVRHVGKVFPRELSGDIVTKSYAEDRGVLPRIGNGQLPPHPAKQIVVPFYGGFLAPVDPPLSGGICQGNSRFVNVEERSRFPRFVLKIGDED